VLGSGSGAVSYSNGTKKLTGRENLTKNTFCVGPVGPTDKENQVKMYKKYCFWYISSMKRQESGSGSIPNSQIRIKLKSRIQIRIKVISRVLSRIRIRRVWICKTGIMYIYLSDCPILASTIGTEKQEKNTSPLLQWNYENYRKWV
jgi:hypothetical protein